MSDRDPSLSSRYAHVAELRGSETAMPPWAGYKDVSTVNAPYDPSFDGAKDGNNSVAAENFRLIRDTHYVYVSVLPDDTTLVAPLIEMRGAFMMYKQAMAQPQFFSPPSLQRVIHIDRDPARHTCTFYMIPAPEVFVPWGQADWKPLPL